MKEWSKKNELNSFNSYKGLLYAPWYQSIRDWKDGKRSAPLPPVEASLDPIHACNLMCDHCNAHRYLLEDNTIIAKESRRMSDEHLINLTKFLGKWGVKAVCYGGGGEPTLHTGLKDALYACKEVGMDCAVVTNGINLDDNLIKAIAETCRWAGISVDAATKDTYKLGKKSDKFVRVISNLKKLAEYCKFTRSRCEVSYKFLIFKYNQHEIYQAAQMAKEMGAKDFHARPADWSHQGMGELKSKIGSYDIDKVLEQFEKCHELEDENFKVYTVVHKFDEDFKPRKDFGGCYASPCCLQLCSDGNAYLCPDQRFSEEYKLGSHYPSPEEILSFWGSPKHYDMVFNWGKDKCTTRCTFAPYCKQAEELFIKDTDPMCKWFI